MNTELLPSELPGIPVQYQLYITWAVFGGKLLAELYSSVRAGGGLKKIIMTFWLGENLPKPVADDYKKELSHHPFPNEEKKP
jgi:hypothetical protein